MLLYLPAPFGCLTSALSSSLIILKVFWYFKKTEPSYHYENRTWTSCIGSRQTIFLHYNIWSLLIHCGPVRLFSATLFWGGIPGWNNTQLLPTAPKLRNCLSRVQIVHYPWCLQRLPPGFGGIGQEVPRIESRASLLGCSLQGAVSLAPWSYRLKYRQVRFGNVTKLRWR